MRNYMFDFFHQCPNRKIFLLKRVLVFGVIFYFYSKNTIVRSLQKSLNIDKARFFSWQASVFFLCPTQKVFLLWRAFFSGKNQPFQWTPCKSESSNVLKYFKSLPEENIQIHNSPCLQAIYRSSRCHPTNFQSQWILEKLLILYLALEVWRIKIAKYSLLHLTEFVDVPAHGW